MGIIQCAEKCRFQKDGYCGLDRCCTVNSVSGSCPYFIAVSPDEGDSLGKPSDPD